MDILKGTSLVLSGNVLARFSGFLATVYLARVLGNQGYGSYVFYITILSYLALLQDPGLSTLGAREIASGEKVEGRIFGTKLLISFILTSLFFLYPPSFRPFVFALIPLSLYPEWMLRGQGEFKKLFFLSLFRSLFFLGSVLLFVPSFRIRGAAYAYAISFLLPSLFFIWKVQPFSFSFSLLRLALPFGISGILYQIYHNSDMLILGIFRSRSELGLYGAAFRVVFLFLLLDRAVETASLPLLSREEKREETVVFLRKLVIAGFIVSAFITVFSRLIILFIFGKEYLLSSLYLSILIWSFPLSLFSTLHAVSLIVHKRDKEYMVCSVCGVLLNLFLNLALIPRYGALAASLSTIVAEILMAYMFAKYDRALARMD